MIEFIDLKAQQARIKVQLDAAIARVLQHGQYILGPEVVELEEKLAAYTGAKHCITVANGTDALQIAQMALGIGPGDEVITTPMTFAATANVIGAFGSAIKTTTTGLLASNGVIASRSDGLSSSVKALDRQMQAMENRLTIIEKSYRAKFSALDTTMTSMSTTSSYLSQQLALLSNMVSN